MPRTSGKIVNPRFMGVPIYTPSTVQTLAAGDTLSFTHPTMVVSGSGGAVTSTATPLIAAVAEINGARITIRGNDDTNTYTIQDDDTLEGSKLRLSGGVSMVLGKGDTIELQYYSADDTWDELTRSGN